MKHADDRATGDRGAQLPRFANRGLIEALVVGVKERLLSDFPDSRIGASLKHRLRQALGVKIRDFPDSRIGASLKPPNRQRLDAPGVILPRFANRGLIEANSGVEARTCQRYFPDSRIGASLKLR